MKLPRARFFHSIIFRNIASFLVILTLIIVPLVVAYLWDIERSMSETLAAQLELVAQQASQMLDPEEVALIKNIVWYETVEYEDIVKTLGEIQENFQVDNAVIYRRLPDKRFVYVADGNRGFAINQNVALHQTFRGTYKAANEAWESGRLGETRLFRSGDNKWFQVNLPIKIEERVVAVLMLNKFATPIANEIRKRQFRILLFTLFVMVSGVLLRFFVSRRQLRPLLLLRRASQEISQGNLQVDVPTTNDRSEIGELTKGFTKMVADLRSSRAELDEYHRTLEMRIEQRTQEIRELMEAQMRQSQKLEAIGTLAGGIAHDFNNILTPIMGYTELAQRSLAEKSGHLMELDKVMEAAGRARDLIAQLLHFSRQSEALRRPIKLDSLVKEVLRLMRSTLPATIGIREEVRGGLSMIDADATQLHALLMNLCINASHAMPDGGELLVSLEERELENFRTPAGEVVSGCYVQLEVTDTGTGMSEEVLARLFEPFFTTKEEGVGTGLGLSAAREIVEFHGGFMEVRSQEGQGTTFIVYLPAIKATEEAAESDIAPVEGGSESVLFVEDEAEIRMLGRINLESLGYRVTVAPNALEALTIFRAAPESFDIVVADQTTPNMTGYRLFMELDSMQPGFPFLIATGLPDSVAEEKGESGKDVPILSKPYTRDDLGRAIRAVLDRSP